VREYRKGVVGMDTTVRKRMLERLGLSDLKAVRENLSPARLVEESVRRGEVVAVTIERAGGVDTPTGEPIVRADV